MDLVTTAAAPAATTRNIVAVDTPRIPDARMSGFSKLNPQSETPKSGFATGYTFCDYNSIYIINVCCWKIN
jgi:hypothetical protein